ncbi:hypothetical protein SSYIS1_10370 [Serratia symbiotica]|uniref:Uncharacterized protein n=1 Tax=Serratia symbiotica TaxID=138074 RepID=A0A455VM30_9GAMM|nr:hypothetical protein SSYIS1_10370 [Serratia symbiotica]
MLRKTLPSEACLPNKYCLLHLPEPKWHATPLYFHFPQGFAHASCTLW